MTRERRRVTRIRGYKQRPPLTLSSADSPRSVSFKELHGNWPVTLYRLRVRLKERTTGRTEAKTAGGLREFPRVRFFVTYLRSKDPG